METRTKHLTLGGLWFALVVLQLYHFRTGEMTLSWITGLSTAVYGLFGCYFVAKARTTD